MVKTFLRNDLIACAGVTVVVCGVAFLLCSLAASPSQPHRTATPTPTHPAVASAQPPAPVQKPTAYGEAFVPPPPPTRALPAIAHAPGAGQPLNVAPRVMEANLISAPPPSYPLLARIAHVRGQVTVQAVISSSGAVSVARALDGHHLLRAAAVDEVRHRRYRPYRMDGQPANVSTVVTVEVGAHS
jgi:periplasmic protein TonB